MHRRSPLVAVSAALVSCAGEASGPKKATGTTDAGGASSGASDTGPVPDAGAPSCEKLSQSITSAGCDAAPNCQAVYGSLIETGTTCAFEATDIRWKYGCVTMPCEPYEGPICKEGTEPGPGTVGYVAAYDPPACVPHGWVPCPEVEVCTCTLAPEFCP